MPFASLHATLTNHRPLLIVALAVMVVLWALVHKLRVHYRDLAKAQTPELKPAQAARKSAPQTPASAQAARRRAPQTSEPKPAPQAARKSAPQTPAFKPAPGAHKSAQQISASKPTKRPENASGAGAAGAPRGIRAWWRERREMRKFAKLLRNRPSTDGPTVRFVGVTPPPSNKRPPIDPRELSAEERFARAINPDSHGI